MIALQEFLLISERGMLSKEKKIVKNATRFITHLRQMTCANMFAYKKQAKSKIICMEAQAKNGKKHAVYKVHKKCERIQLNLHKMKNKNGIFVIKIKKWHADCWLYRQKAKQQRTLLQPVAARYLPNLEEGKAKSSRA